MVKYYALTIDLSYSNYENFQFAQHVNPYLIIIENKNTWQNGQYNNVEYDFQLFNTEGIPISEIKEGLWRLTNLQVRSDYYVQKRDIYFDVIAPNGEVTTKKFGSCLTGIVAGISFLRKLSKYESWVSYELSVEISNLLRKVSVLEQEIETLRIENHNLKSKSGSH